MSVFSSFLQLFSKRNDQQQNEHTKSLNIPWGNAFGASSDGTVSSNRALHQFRGWVYRAVSVNAMNVANVKLELVNTKADGTKEIITDHSMLDVLNFVNNRSTLYDFLELDEVYQGLVGNSFWLIDRNDFGRPDAIFMLDPTKVKVIPSAEVLKVGQVLSYEITTSRGQVQILPEDIIHRKSVNPLSQLEGYGDFRATALAHEVDRAQLKYNKSFFDNNAIPPFAFTSENPIDDDVWKRIKSRWNELFRGPSNQHKIGVLEDGLDIKELGATQRDLEYIEGRKFTRDEIFTIYGIPPEIAGITENSNRATITGAEFIYSKYTLSPKMEKLINSLNEFYVPLFPDPRKLSFTFVSPIPKDEESAIKNLSVALAGQPWMSQNEARAARNLEPVDGGEDLVRQFNLFPVDGDTDQDEKSMQFNRVLERE